ncbi:DegT/DnrJ/EryC1/StrS family aminotransferase [Schlesneria paludicola]|uniref:DegT/DnrJ/EryC1/StrS family aminotransferase n=1 Tax=Schlesneria paludicola TaxID=360056 RepID=UPI00029A44B6|nr:DegT/DnrJ/EryC1/StrS family aminotransferase [Schlesneria paludicola]
MTITLSLSNDRPVPFIDLVPQFNAMSAEIMSVVEKVFTEQKFILGDEVANLETEIAQYCDARHAIGCNSGTDALIIALQALGIGEGDEVITTPFSFFATASSICRAGATPVFVDIEPDSFNIDPRAIEEAITPRTRAIMPVHLFGQCCDMESIWRLAQKHDLHIVEDACQAIGSEYQGRRAGVLGSVGCFSFFPTKNLGGAGDGGMMTTDDPEVAQRLKRLRVHGDIGQYEHLEVGMNSRLDSLQAAVLRVKLRQLESWTIARQENARRYGEMFRNEGVLDTICLPKTGPHRRHVYNQYCVRVRHGHRDQLMQELKAKKIGCAVYYPKPLHLQTCFKGLGCRPGQFPEAEAASRDILALPSYPELPLADQERVVSVVSEVCRELRGNRQQRRAA